MVSERQAANPPANLWNPDEQQIQQLLSQQLSEEWRNFRAPAGFDQALNETNNITQIFAAAGFWPLYAYYLGTSRHSGLKAILQTFSDATLRQIAGELLEVEVHESLKTSVNLIFVTSARGNKRRKLLPIEIPIANTATQNQSQQGVSTQHIATESPSPTPGPSLPADSTPVPSMHTQAEAPPACSSDGGPAHSDSIQSSSAIFCRCIHPPFHADPEYQWAWPSAKGLPFVFPHSMCEMIEKVDNKAAIMLTFTSDTAACSLMWDIAASDVPYVAEKLFGTSLKHDGRRLIRQDGIGRIHALGVTLVESEAERWDSLLGPAVGGAIRHSPRRMQELADGLLLSGCLTFWLCGVADHPGRLHAMTDFVKMAEIKQRLWLP